MLPSERSEEFYCHITNTRTGANIVFLAECQSTRRFESCVSMSERAIVRGRKKRKYLGNPIKIGPISRAGIRARREGARSEFKRHGCHVIIMSIYFFLSFSPSSRLLPQQSRKLQTTNPGGFTHPGIGGGVRFARAERVKEGEGSRGEEGRV